MVYLELVDHEPAVSPLALSRAQREAAPPPKSSGGGRRYAARVLFLIGLLLAVFVLPSPWGLVAVVVGGVLDIAETGLFPWRSRRRRCERVETLVGKTGIASTELWPEGQVRIAGEIWQARCQGGCNAGTKVVVGRRAQSTPPRRAWRSGPRSRAASS